MKPSNLKRKVHEFCEQYVYTKKENVHAAIEKIGLALQAETKSTAGDKHETGRAMLQLEREQLGRQLQEVERMERAFRKIAITPCSARVALGSLVKTNLASYYLSISAGHFKADGHNIYCISPASPIGQLLVGRSIGEVISFNGNELNILEIQ